MAHKLMRQSQIELAQTGADTGCGKQEPETVILSHPENGGFALRQLVSRTGAELAQTGAGLAQRRADAPVPRVTPKGSSLEDNWRSPSEPEADWRKVTQ